MATVTRLPLASKIKELRLHSRRPAAGTPEAAKVTVLLDLGAQKVQRDAERRLTNDLIVAIGKVVADLPREVGARLDEVAAIAVELGLGIAREVVGAALDKGLVDPTPTVVRCLRDCVHGADRGDLVVRLHPDDVAPVQARLAELPELAEEVARARFVGDRAVPRGGVRAETETGRLRYDPKQALERIAEEVRREVAS